MNQIEATASVITLLIMAGISAELALLFQRKIQTLNKLSHKINVNVFDKTYNVWSPYPAKRKTINDIIIWPFAIMLVIALFAMTFSKIFETGIALALVILILSIALMMPDEATEINTTANQFADALNNQTGFGKGDAVALHVLRQTMPKLKKYFILLAALFTVSAATLPYIVEAGVTALTQTLGTTMAATSTLGIISPYLSLLVLTVLVTMITFTAGRIKTQAFGLGPSPTQTSIEEQFERITIMAKWGEAPPFELSHRPVLEDPEVEERKRKALDPQE